MMFLLHSCSNETKLEPIKSTENISSEVKLSEIAQVDKIIKINYNDFKIFSEIGSIRRLNNLTIVHSLSPSMISVLDQSGMIISQLQPTSDGPASINGITEIKTLNNSIYVLDREHFKIYTLNLELELLSKIKLNFFCQSFEPLGDNNYLLYTGHEKTENNDSMFLFYDSNKNIVKKQFLPIHDNTPNFFKFLTRNHIIRLDNGNLLLWDSSKNFIYNYSEDIIEKFYIDYGSYKLENDFYNTASFGNSYEFLTEMRKLNYAFRHFNLMANQKYITFTYEIKGEFSNTIYNSKTGKILNYKNINDDLITNISFSGLDYFSSLFGKDEFVTHISYEYLSNSNKDILKSAHKSNSDVLVFGNLKF